ncbi:farnesyl pyrophosphate synthase-like [Ornithodoros turicata]|uniref:farnesyl pyrophosphate synthase-like n=1 Tax=Ornithodoros turicata TaxID=34597 RepID=UPI003139A7BA
MLLRPFLQSFIRKITTLGVQEKLQTAGGHKRGKGVRGLYVAATAHSSRSSSSVNFKRENVCDTEAHIPHFEMSGHKTQNRLLVLHPTDEPVEKAYKKLVADLTTTTHSSPMADVAKTLRQVLDYNVPHGKRNRLMAVVHTYQLLSDKEALPDKIELACLVGWCIELLQAYFLIADDIMDKSTMRRGRPCWYTVEGVGLRAINDAFFLQGAVFRVLRENLGHLAVYHDLVELFLNINYSTVEGQCLDMLSSPEGTTPDLKEFTDQRYAAIAEHKTAYYSFVLPIRAGMYVAGISDPQQHADAEKVAVKIGHAFQVQDDFLDIYGNPEHVGKIGTDIVDGKCSWLVVKALQLMNARQRETFTAHFACGKPGGPDELAIKALYDELGLVELYNTYIAQTFQAIDEMLEKPWGHPSLPAVFREVMKAILKRTK